MDVVWHIPFLDVFLPLEHMDYRLSIPFYRYQDFYPKFDPSLKVFLAIQRFTILICAAVYYKLFGILIFLNGIFLYFSRS